MKFTRGDVVWVPCEIYPSDAPGDGRFILISAETDNDWAGDVSANSLAPDVTEENLQHGPSKARVIIVGTDEESELLEVGVLVTEELIHSSWFWIPTSVAERCDA